MPSGTETTPMMIIGQMSPQTCETVAPSRIAERVASELEHATAAVVPDLEESRERRVHHLCQLLRALLPEAGKALGGGREARDVDEREASLNLLPRLLRLVAQPLERDQRNERNQLLRAG